MLPNSTITIAKNALLGFLSDGKCISPAGDALLNLNNKSLPPSQIIIQNDDQLANSLNMLEQISNNDQHHACLYDTAEELKKILEANLAFVHGVVKPKVSDFVLAYSNFLVGVREPEPAASISIIQRIMPDLAHNTFVTNSFDTTPNYENAPPGMGKNFILNGIADQDQLIDFLKFEQPALDRDIAAWVLSSTAVMPMFQCFFGSGGTYKNVENLREAGVYTGIDAVDAGLLIGLVASKMKASVRDDQSHLSLLKYEQACDEHMDFASMLLKRGLDQQPILQKTGKVIDYVDTVAKVIHVNAEIYSDWLTNQNGKPEILLGAFISGERSLSTSQLNERSIQLLKTWDSYCVMSRMQFEARLSTAVRRWIASYMFDQIEQFSKSNETDAFYRQDAYRVDAKSVVEAKVNELDDKILTDVWDVALIVVAGGMFYNSCAYEFLMDLHRIGEKNPSIDAHDAVSIASIRYLSDYVSTMMKLIKL